MPGFPSASRVRSVFAPGMASAARQLGSLCDIHAIVPTIQKDNTYVDTPQISGSDIEIRLKSITKEQAQSVFGFESVAQMKGSLASSVDVQEGNVIVVTDGDFLGEWLKVEKLIEKPLSNSYVLGLVSTKALA